MLAPNMDPASSAVEIGAAAENTTRATTLSMRTRFDDEAIRRWVQTDEALKGWMQAGRPARGPTVPVNRQDLSTRAPSVPPPDLGVVRYPSPARELPREVVLQEWEGHVQEVGEHVFSARLVDLTQDSKEETEETDLPIEDLGEADRRLLIPGATFRWIIGYRWANGEKERFTRVVIRRLPIWTEQEIKSADQEAAELHNALFGNAGQRAASPGSD
jgi:hypothetical protein